MNLNPNLGSCPPPKAAVHPPLCAGQTWGSLGEVNSGNQGDTPAQCLKVIESHPSQVQGPVWQGWAPRSYAAAVYYIPPILLFIWIQWLLFGWPKWSISETLDHSFLGKIGSLFMWRSVTLEKTDLKTWEQFHCSINCVESYTLDCPGTILAMISY